MNFSKNEYWHCLQIYNDFLRKAWIGLSVAEMHLLVDPVDAGYVPQPYNQDFDDAGPLPHASLWGGDELDFTGPGILEGFRDDTP